MKQMMKNIPEGLMIQKELREKAQILAINPTVHPVDFEHRDSIISNTKKGQTKHEHTYPVS